MRSFKSSYLLHEPREFWTVLPYCGEIIWRLWSPTLPTLPEDAFGRIRKGCEEISSRCPARFHEAKAIEILCSRFNWPKVDLTALIQNGDSVKGLNV